MQEQKTCIKGELNPRRIESLYGNDPGYHYPINAWKLMLFVELMDRKKLSALGGNLKVPPLKVLDNS